LVTALIRSSQKGDDLTELRALAESAGANVVDKFQQKISRINPSTYIGKGKAWELSDRVKRFKADVVIFDNDLSPAQIRELEKVLKIKVLDRSELILDIFATRAKTRQAKLQVELAQLEYTYPRLTRMWTHLEGIGTRGPGEKQLEIDRRLVNKRITDLKRELTHIDKRKIREITGRKNKFKVCLVGYTNAGKSTLLNQLTDASVFVEDRLFATLDTRTKKWVLDRGVDVLLSDTVGFIRNLPHQLVASFKATLEEAVNADLLLHIADVSNPEVLGQIESVKQVLQEIGCRNRPALLVLNKVDEDLKEKVLVKYKGQELFLRIISKQSNGKVQHFIRACGTIVKETYRDGTVEIEARLGSNQLAELKRMRPGSLEIIET
jgi:GTP-binding protein HflX